MRLLVSGGGHRTTIHVGTVNPAHRLREMELRVVLAPRFANLVKMKIKSMKGLDTRIDGVNASLGQLILGTEGRQVRKDSRVEGLNKLGSVIKGGEGLIAVINVSQGGHDGQINLIISKRVRSWVWIRFSTSSKVQ
jgi:hypothetical protein